MIKSGDRLPVEGLKMMGANGPEDVDMAAKLKDRKIILIGVPGAFTPTCSDQHLPSFLNHHDALKAKGVDEIICMSVNDFFVVDAWAQQKNTGTKVTMVADGSGIYTKALGLELDLTERGLGVRSQRFAMIVEDGVISHLAVEEGPAFEVSSAESVLAAL